MGNSASIARSSYLEFLEKIAGNQPIPLTDQAVWKALFTYTTPLASYDPEIIQSIIRPHTASLVYHNSHTLNCQRLFYILCQQISQLSTPLAASIATANALYVARAILKDLIEQLNTTQLLAFIELSPAILHGEAGPELQEEFSALENGSLIFTLVKTTLASLEDLSNTTSLTPGAYLFQTELIDFLLVMASTQLYTTRTTQINSPPNQTPSTTSGGGRQQQQQHVFLEAMMMKMSYTGIDNEDTFSIDARTVQSLLNLYISRPKPPTGLTFFVPSTPRTSYYFVRAATSTVLWLPYTAYSFLRRNDDRKNQLHSPLGDAALSLLLTLYFYPPAHVQLVNPYRRALKNLHDADDVTGESDVAAEGGMAGMIPSVQYSLLYDTLHRTLLHQESSILLLYALIHGTPRFNDYCMARSDIDILLVPLLELLYSAHGRSTNQLYMLLIILLILSQDTAFAANIHRVKLRSVPFYKERPLVDTTVGSLLVVLLLRTAHYNLTVLKDMYLHSNTLATLANLAPSISSLSSHTAQRIVHIVSLLQKRHTNLFNNNQNNDSSNTSTESGSMGSPPSFIELQLYSDFLRINLEIINAILTNNLRLNPELIYAIVHRQEVFEPFKQDPKFSDLMENIELVISHFGKKIDAAMSNQSSGVVSADRILDVIKTASMGWGRNKLKTFPELRFTYEEEASSEEFFLPYVWSLVISTESVAIPWTLSAITAFDPVGLSTSTHDNDTSTEEKGLQKQEKEQEHQGNVYRENSENETNSLV